MMLLNLCAKTNKCLPTVKKQNLHLVNTFKYNVSNTPTFKKKTFLLQYQLRNSRTNILKYLKCAIKVYTKILKSLKFSY